MSNPNTTTVYDPNGEAFEMARANARDLVSHMGWTFQKPTVIVKEVAAEKPADTSAQDSAAEEAAAAKEAKEAEEAAAAKEAKEAEEAAAAEAAAAEAAAAEAAAKEAKEAEEAAANEDAADDAAADEAPFTSEEQFAGMEERDDLVAYLAKHFPDFKPHHKAGRDGLVAKAIELANG